MYLMSSVQQKRKTRSKGKSWKILCRYKKRIYWQNKRFQGMQWKSDDKCSNQKHLTWGHSPKPEVALLGVENKGKIWKLCVPHNLMLPSTVLAKNPNLLQYTEVANCKSFHNVYSTSHQAPKTTRQHLGTTSKALKVSSSFFEICIF